MAKKTCLIPAELITIIGWWFRLAISQLLLFHHHSLIMTMMICWFHDFFLIMVVWITNYLMSIIFVHFDCLFVGTSWCTFNTWATWWQYARWMLAYKGPYNTVLIGLKLSCRTWLFFQLFLVRTFLRWLWLNAHRLLWRLKHSLLV